MYFLNQCTHLPLEVHVKLRVNFPKLVLSFYVSWGFELTLLGLVVVARQALYPLSPTMMMMIVMMMIF